MKKERITIVVLISLFSLVYASNNVQVVKPTKKVASKNIKKAQTKPTRQVSKKNTSVTDKKGQKGIVIFGDPVWVD